MHSCCLRCSWSTGYSFFQSGNLLLFGVSNAVIGGTLALNAASIALRRHRGIAYGSP
jgi:hypothetical protein